jgi:hypothetical protein
MQVFEETRKPDFVENFGRAIGKAVPQYLQGQQQQKNKAAENAKLKLMGIDIEGVQDPELRKIAFSKGLDAKSKKDEADREEKRDKDFIREFLTESDAQDVEKPNKQGIPKWKSMSEAKLAELKLRDPKKGKIIEDLRKEDKELASNQPISEKQLAIMKQVRSQPGFNDLDDYGQYLAYIDNGVSPINAEREAKLKGSQLERGQKNLDSAYKAQQDFIEDTTNKYKGFETDMKPRLMQMRNIPDEDLISPTSAVFLDALGIPLGALDDPSSELYHKLSQDLLKGLPETYGSRILKVEVDNFLKTIPTLLNSPDGRRMIASNMLKLGEMKEVYYNEMRREQKEADEAGKPLPRDFQQNVFDQVKPQIDKINNEFVKLSEIKSVPQGTIPFFGPDGQIQFVPKEHAQWALENGGKRIW